MERSPKREPETELKKLQAENFFGIMKSELLYAQIFETPEYFIKSLKEYIDYYNNIKN